MTYPPQWSRTLPKFRYEGDMTEVTLRMPANDAYELATLLTLAGAPNGKLLLGFLEDTEGDDTPALVKQRRSDTLTEDPDVKRIVQKALASLR